MGGSIGLRAYRLGSSRKHYTQDTKHVGLTPWYAFRAQRPVLIARVEAYWVGTAVAKG